MSGTRLITTSPPFTRPVRMPMRSTARTIGTDSSGALRSSTAEMTFVSAMTDPIERSMPPEITTIAWPAAANATGSEAMAKASRPVPGSEEQREDEERDERDRETDRPCVAPHRPREPVAPAHPLRDRLGDDSRLGRLGHAASPASAGSPCAARSRVGSSASEAGSSSTTRPA